MSAAKKGKKTGKRGPEYLSPKRLAFLERNRGSKRTGQALENVRAASKKRGKTLGMTGKKNPKSNVKLVETPDGVFSYAQLTTLFGVHRVTIVNRVNNGTYKDSGKCCPPKL